MPEIHLDDTIAAIATPPGEGGIGVIRISGPEAISIAAKIVRPRLQFQTSHTVHHGHIVDQKETVIDEVLVTVFRKPKSYTAEDVIEISGHGGTRVLRHILDLILKNGARHAEPGEFTRRAFLNGRLDLTQAEAVSDLICAKTEKSVESALRQLDGKLSREIHSIKDRLMKIYAHLEAYLDFPDEDLEIYSNEEMKSGFEQTLNRLKSLIGSYQKGHLLRDGACVVICGRPNVGKSSLLNVLLDRDRALVSEIPGTTRDILEESIEIDGLWIRLVDTAGLWTSQHPLDQAAMERTQTYFSEGDLFLWVVDAGDGLVKDDLSLYEKIKNKNMIAVMNKTDLKQTKKINMEKYVVPACTCFVSAKTRQGIETLEKKIVQSILQNELGQEPVLITRLRHKRALENSVEALEQSYAAFLKGVSLELITPDIKRSLDSLKELVGEIYHEDLLDVIFSEFCIGK